MDSKEIIERGESKFNMFRFPLNTSFRLEKEFTTWFGRMCNNKWWEYHKISDADPRLKWYDAYCVVNGKFYAIEIKRVTSKSYYPFRLLRGSSYKLQWIQVKRLQNTIDNWWEALVIVYSTSTWQYHLLDFKDLTFDTKIV